MHRDLVETKRWISEARFLHALNYCMVLPGPEAQQLATYIGWLLHRTWGGVMAGALFVLPSLVLLIALSWLYLAHGDVPAVAGVLYGIKPAVVADRAARRVAHRPRALKHPLLWAIAAAAFVAICAFAAPFPAIVLAAAAIGAIGGRLLPRAFAAGARHGAGGGGHARRRRSSTTTRRRRPTRASRPGDSRGGRRLRRALAGGVRRCSPR